MKDFKIRTATPDDLYSLIVLSQQFCKEQGYHKYLNVDVEHIKKQIEFHLNSPTSFFKVVESEDTIVGFFTGTTGNTFVSTDIVATELVIYLTPNYRGGSCAIKLLKQFESWSKEKQAKFISLTHPEIFPKVGKLYSRLGYKPLEHVYIKEM